MKRASRDPRLVGVAAGEIGRTGRPRRATAPSVISDHLNETEHEILLQIIDEGTVTRSTLSQQLGLSKATLSGAIKYLSGAGLISELGVERGMGRPAAIYQASEGAGYALGVDLGTTLVRVRAVAIDGRTLAEREEPVRPSRTDVSPEAPVAAVSLMRQLARELEARGSALRGCVIAAPIKISFGEPPPERLAPVIDVVESFDRHPGLEVQIENNVNCAAIAEGERGAAIGVPTFAYLQVGVKIGLGIVNEGRLLRGAQGGAGEVSCLPYPWGAGERPSRFGLEKHLGAHSLISRAKRQRGVSRQSSFDTASMFARAEEGDPYVKQLIEEHAREVGEMAAAVVAILDPGLVVLGGGVGQSPLLLRGVRASLAKLTWSTEVRSSTLGSDATVMGAARLAADAALADALTASTNR